MTNHPPIILKWRGLTVLFGGSVEQALMLGYMADALARTTTRSA
jgi:hypothetical protein